ncbi:MAG: hypothetical protein RLN88_06535 [Ekhidna sp.]|uniref:hypothetical protein n=1 Tax=Ekhidna sp. TaxID=2608089 RepID=UPI0032EE4664
MKLIHIFALVLLLITFFGSCQQKSEKAHLEYFRERTFTFLEPANNEEHYFTDSLKSFWRADTAQLYLAERIILIALNNLETQNFVFTSETLPNFMRQYVCFINEQNERMIWVNAHCNLPKVPPDIDAGETEFQHIDWRNELVIIDDGGDCHWNILINLDKGTYSNFFINT